MPSKAQQHVLGLVPPPPACSPGSSGRHMFCMCTFSAHASFILKSYQTTPLAHSEIFKAPYSLPLCEQGCLDEFGSIRDQPMQAAVELSLIAAGDARSKQPPKRAPGAPAHLRNGGPKPAPTAYSSTASSAAPYQDPRRAPAAPAPQRASLFQSLAARPAQPANVTPVGARPFRPKDCHDAGLVKVMHCSVQCYGLADCSFKKLQAFC